MDAETKGRWWRTGARWSGHDEGGVATAVRRKKCGRGDGEGNDDDNDDDDSDNDGDGGNSDSSDEDDCAHESGAVGKHRGGQAKALATAAAACHMNTPARKAAFEAIMGSISVEDAAARLGDLAASHLKGSQVVTSTARAHTPQASHNIFEKVLFRAPLQHIIILVNNKNNNKNNDTTTTATTRATSKTSTTAAATHACTRFPFPRGARQ